MIIASMAIRPAPYLVTPSTIIVQKNTCWRRVEIVSLKHLLNMTKIVAVISVIVLTVRKLNNSPVFLLVGRLFIAGKNSFEIKSEKFIYSEYIQQACHRCRWDNTSRAGVKFRHFFSKQHGTINNSERILKLYSISAKFCPLSILEYVKIAVFFNFSTGEILGSSSVLLWRFDWRWFSKLLEIFFNPTTHPRSIAILQILHFKLPSIVMTNSFSVS